MQTKSGEPELTYFGIQAEWGVTKHFGGQPATRRLAELCGLAPSRSGGKKALVIGCGAGLPAVSLVETFGCHVTGIDLSPRMLAWARQRAARKGVQALAEFQAADAQNLPFEDGAFDAVLCESVTAFIPDKAAALREYPRVTGPQGRVGLNEGTWLTQDPPAELVEFVRRTMGGVDFLWPQGWQALLSGAGLEIQTCDVRQMQPGRQFRDETAGMDRYDWWHALRAYGRVMQLLLTHAGFRAYTRAMIPSRRVTRALFEHLGYGLYVGGKGQA